MSNPYPFLPPGQREGSAALVPTSFRHVIGQDDACEILTSAIRAGRVPHAYLFVGPQGVGKRTVAAQWAKILNCTDPISETEACENCSNCRKIGEGKHPDVLNVNFEWQARLLDEPPEKQRALKINTVREMGHILRLKPAEAPIKIAFLDPADQLVDVAAHALLKILEEPPPNTHLVLLAQDASQLLGTIRSRCQWVRFRPLPADVLVAHLQTQVPDCKPEEAKAAAAQAEGSLQRALAILEGLREIDFDWENAPLSELLGWCDEFHSPRMGRDAVETFLRRLLGRFQSELHEGAPRAAAVARVLDALHQLKQNVSPQLIVETLLLRFRLEKRRSAGQ